MQCNFAYENSLNMFLVAYFLCSTLTKKINWRLFRSKKIVYMFKHAYTIVVLFRK
jgi:hypothetical protein